CGLHITEVLAGLSLEQICSCDDDRDSEHPWTTLADQTTTAVTSSTSSSSQEARTDPVGHCPNPSPIEYRLSKISAATAEVAPSRMAQQAAALEELRRIKQEKERELKEANEGALQKLIHGLSDVKEDVITD
ncbi:hypothetical protein BX616_003553, partial [Lobosporangium transversale]